jgi:hypothetical protein
MLTYSDIYRHLKLTALAAAMAATAGLAPAQVGLGLTPMREDLKLSPGAQRSGVLTLTNDASAPVRVAGEALDFHLDATATPQFGRQPEEAEYSCRQWLTLNPVELELNAGDHVPVRYTLRVPQSATERSFHCAIGYTTQPTASRAGGTGLRTAVQIVAAIYVVVGNPAMQGSLKDVRLEYLADPRNPGWQAVVVIHNAGLMHFRPDGDLDVLNDAGAVVESAKFVPLPVLPKRDQNFLFPLKLAGGPGKYTLRARVDLGGDEIQEATAAVVAARPAP